MSKFKFECIDTNEDGKEESKVTMEFEADVWLDAFPKFLDFLRGSGFIISHETRMYAPTASEYIFGDRDFLLFEDDLVDLVDMVDNSQETWGNEASPSEQREQYGNEIGNKTLDQWAAEGGLNHTENFYDTARNR